jgi:hypothetical protein
MTEAVQIALIVAAGPFAMGVLNAWLAYRSHQKLEIVHKEFNGMKDELVASVKSDATAKGHAEGMKEQRDVDKEKQSGTP